MATYWQAELYRYDELWCIDFPRRATAAEALADAEERLSTLSNRGGVTAGAAEWYYFDGLSRSTGRYEEHA